MDCAVSLISCNLDRIADALSGFDWSGLVATFIATVVGAIVGTFVSLWASDRARPRPHWRAETSAPTHFKDGVGSVGVTVTNIGDGVAYNPRLSIVGADSNGPPARKAILEPGESMQVALLAPGDGRYTYNPLTDALEDTRQISWPSDASALIEWQEPPKRNRVRRHSLALEDPLPLDP